jgi:hypothetical protein
LSISQFHKLHNIVFFEKTKIFLLSIFHSIHFLNAMFGHKVENIIDIFFSQYHVFVSRLSFICFC